MLSPRANGRFSGSQPRYRSRRPGLGRQDGRRRSRAFQRSKGWRPPYDAFLQCDACHFENCKRRSPIEGNLQDEVALLGIRRANLDSPWSRERSTVRANRLQGRMWISASESAGWLDHGLPKRGPYPVEDTFGMQAAVNLLLRSRSVGINSKTIQYETTRKLRSFLSNFVHSTFQGHGDMFMSEDGNGGIVSRSPTNSPWFKRFMRGLHKRMGDMWIPDRALLKREFTYCLLLLEEDWAFYSNVDDIGGKSKTY